MKMNIKKSVWVVMLCLVCLASPVLAVDGPGQEQGAVPNQDAQADAQTPPPKPKGSEWGLLKAPNLVDKITQAPAGRHQGTAPGKETLEKQAEKERRDPFAATPKLTREKKIETSRKEGHPMFVPGNGPANMPKLRLRGHLQGRDNKVVALLEIQGGGVYIVREGDTIGLHEFGYNSVIQIKKISRLHLVVESGQLGQLIIVR